MKLFYIFFLTALFMVACSDDDSGDFLTKPKDTAYSNEEDDFSSSSAQFSSSSELRSSSSSLYSSSSVSSSSSIRLDIVPYVPPCRDEYADSCGYGALVDERDGQTYRIVEIGEQTWMAENLNFKMDSSECYEKDQENCEHYGRLYLWPDAMEICPSGWHLPTLDEWKILYTYAGGIETSASKLRATEGWSDRRALGSDRYGFSVLPGGAYRADHGRFQDITVLAYFWTSTDYEDKEGDVYNICFDNRDEIVDGHGPKFEGNQFSVRCIKD